MSTCCEVKLEDDSDAIVVKEELVVKHEPESEEEETDGEVKVEPDEPPINHFLGTYRPLSVKYSDATLQSYLSRFTCELCGYRASQKCHLREHMLTHSDEKPFACNICDYRAIRSSHLKRHMLAHTGEKPHVCDVCGYKTGYPSALKTHIRTHSGERPYACEVCGYRVSRFGDLKAHMRTHTGEKPYSCEFCEYKSGKLSNLKTHTRTHTGEKPYECDICEYSVGHCSALKRHMRKHHGIVAGASLKLMLGDGISSEMSETKTPMKRKRSLMWQYFDAIDAFYAICKICGGKVAFRSTTSNLKRHMTAKHPNVIMDEKQGWSKQS
ncbi:hypothetical protein GE061_008639 [Apolygus lucorum]|uniref:Protein krueppel n=1 Tax=Apolygus lucorum TaxID=248454 RepID=A0A8S9WLC4_APOLU|nr:hypothetical protein GE061_008639 [Apolygus lucorum]